MMDNRVCGVIVTYHPDSDLEQHIAALRGQLGGLVVVDNRSSDAERDHLRQLAGRHSFTLLENDENRGIGTALNQGIRWAAGQKSFLFVALFDQDSEVDAGFIGSLVTQYDQHPRKDKVAVVAPKLYNRNTGLSDTPQLHEEETYLVAQTSGSLMPLEVFRLHGYFMDELFIDFVDYEYCLRVAGVGWMISYCEQAVLSHMPGNSHRRFLCGIYLATTYNYSRIRHYYMMRNAVWMIRRYWRQQPRWCAELAIKIWIQPIKASVFEEDRAAKVLYALRGMKDALQNRLGCRMSRASTDGRSA